MIAAISLVHKIMAYELEADQCDHGTGAQLLIEIGVQTLRLVTDNPQKLVDLEGHASRLPLNAHRIPFGGIALILKYNKEIQSII